ncbi:hypothetical protein MKX01_023051 [Papaver californicum]|nr:hypothetical protein MKX01_023051 [Papaver californicum]
MLENLRQEAKVTLLGDSISELTTNLDAHGTDPHPVVAVVAGAYVKQYLGKPSLSSTNATKIYFDPNIPEALLISQGSSHRAPPREISLPARVGYQPAVQSATGARKTISELVETKWGAGYNLLNRKICRAKAVGISLDKGWFYLGCHNCSTKLVGNQGDHWCPACRVQIAEPVPRYLLKLEVEDSTGSAFFVVMDNEVQKMVALPASDAVTRGEEEGLATVKSAFEPLIGVFHDYHIMISLYNMKNLDTPSFTVSKLPSTHAAATTPMSGTITDIQNPVATHAAAITPKSGTITEIQSPDDTPTPVEEPPLEKPCLEKSIEQTPESIHDEN